MTPLPSSQPPSKRNKWNYTVREIQPCELEFAHKLLDWSRNIERVGEVKSLYRLADILSGEDEGAVIPRGLPRSAATGIAPSSTS